MMAQIIPLNPNHGTTEDEIALSFERANSGRYQYNATRGQWHYWTGATWAADETQMVLDAIRQHCRAFASSKFHKAASVKGVETFCRASRAFARVNADFDRDPWLLGTPSGTVDLRSGKLRSAAPSDLITRSTSTAPKTGTPVRWLRFLKEVTGGDNDLIRYLQQVAGYTLTGDTSAHAVFFLYGDGGTGKSTFLNTLQRVSGSYAKTAPMDTFAAANFDKHPTELAMLAGARLVCANETEQGRKWAAARIKGLSGGDDITARFVRHDFFTFRPEFKLVFVGNFAPTFETVDEAMRRRFFVIPFDIKPSNKDEHLMETLEKEAPQILAWAIAGCVDWQVNGLVPPVKVKAATDLYFETQDTFAHWMEEHVSRADRKFFTAKSRALASWNAFRRRTGDNPEANRDLHQRLRRAGFHDGRSPNREHRERVWFGMELIDGRDWTVGPDGPVFST